MLLALLSAVLLGDVSRSNCSMHGGAGIMAAMGPMTVQSTGARRSSSTDAMPAHDHGSPSRDDKDEDCCCSCIGDCSFAPIAMLPSATTLHVATLEAQPRRVLHARTSQVRPASADRRLPFANGPPATRVS
jgi:hypothetical protein